MLRSAAKMIGYRVSALDGEIGRCEDFLLDESQWRVRYLIVKSSAWLSGRSVLVSPLELRKADWTSRRLVLEGSRECLRKRMSVGSYSSSDRGINGQGSDSTAGDASASDSESGAGSGPRQILRSGKEILGYGLQAQDQRAGRVADFIVDDDTWGVAYLVTDSEDWLEGRKTLVPTEWVSGIDREQQIARVARTSSEVEAAPMYDPTAPGLTANAPEALRQWPRPASTVAGGPLRPWHWAQPETWGTHGLRAALARIIQG